MLDRRTFIGGCVAALFGRPLNVRVPLSWTAYDIACEPEIVVRQVDYQPRTAEEAIATRRIYTIKYSADPRYDR